MANLEVIGQPTLFLTWNSGFSKLLKTGLPTTTIHKIFDSGPSKPANLSCDYYWTTEDTISGAYAVGHGNTACIEVTHLLLWKIDSIIITFNLYMLQTWMIHIWMGPGWNKKAKEPADQKDCTKRGNTPQLNSFRCWGSVNQ